MKLTDVMIVVGVLGLTASIVVPNMIERRSASPEHYARNSMGTIERAQSIFRERSRRYATMTELSTTQLVDGLLGQGTKGGYLFRSEPSASTPEFLWWATGTPTPPTQSRGSRRWFACSQAGEVWWSDDGPVAIDPVTCVIDTRTATTYRLRR
jgi:type II secretory pathway pseudopilin PulG